MNTGYIYKIVDNTNDNIYIGSTIHTLHNRLLEHKRHYTKYQKDKCIAYTSSFDIIKNDDYKIELLETIEFSDKKDLRKLEQTYIENNECINKINAFATDELKIKQKNDSSKKIYNTSEKRRTYIKNYNNEYYDNNKEYYSNYHKNKTTKVLCECGCEVRYNNLIRHRKTDKHNKCMEQLKDN